MATGIRHMSGQGDQSIIHFVNKNTKGWIKFVGGNFVFSHPVKGMEDIVTTDKALLKETIDLANTLVEEDYTSESWDNFVSILETAVLIYESSTYTQSEVVEVWGDLQGAVENLVEV